MRLRVGVLIQTTGMTEPILIDKIVPVADEGLYDIFAQALLEQAVAEAIERLGDDQAQGQGKGKGTSNKDKDS